MRQLAGWLLSALLLAAMPKSGIADTPSEQIGTPFTPFTGKVTRNKVRLRLQPNLDGQILNELTKDDLLIVIDEEGEYYAVEPPKGTKAYIYRPYVIDNVVEGNHVNIRLEPDTESPVLVQLNTGDTVDGVVSPLNSKWLEIAPPPSVRFFISKEYISNVGDASMIARMERRRTEVDALLDSTQTLCQTELQKPYEKINLAAMQENLDKIKHLYSDFPSQAARAEELEAKVNGAYIQKKIAYLEAKAAMADYVSIQNNLSLQKRRQQEPGKNIDESAAPNERDWNQAFDPGVKTQSMMQWVPVERELYNTWSMSHEGSTLQNYYTEQFDKALFVRGIVEPYQRATSNKPGDYILVNSGTNLPVAYLYSTQVNLQDLVGKEATLRVAPRSNNHFAFPAYFVLAAE